MAKHSGATKPVPSNSAASEQSSDSPSGSKPPAGLYLVATPIGNLDDITVRAIKILSSVDVIACEDSRVTAKLLMLLGIKTPQLVPYHDHNADKAGADLLQRLRAGGRVALVSDAGTPLLSDPGFPLVRDCLAEQIPVTALPGPSALLTALQLSGLPSDRFLFAGFLPNKEVARRRALQELSRQTATLIFYESPHRLADSLADMADIFGARPAAMARELTKMFEEVRRDCLPALADHYRRVGAPKGEVVLLVGGHPGEEVLTEQDIDVLLRQALAHQSLRDAVAAVAETSGHPKREVYARAVRLQEDDGAA